MPDPDADRLTDDEYDDLLHRNQKIQDTAATEGWALLVDRANVRRAQLQDRLAFGRCDDWEDYLQTVAEFKGVEYVLNLPDTVAVQVDAMRSQRVLDEQGGDE